MKVLTDKFNRLSILVLILFSAQCFSVKADAEDIYVWKDEQGHIHATDRPPPDNAQLIETMKAPASAPPEKNTGGHKKKLETGNWDYWENKRRAEDAKKRAKAAESRVEAVEKKEAAALQAADEASKKAEDFSKKGGSPKKRRWYRRQAEKYQHQADKAAAEAKALAEQKKGALRGKSPPKKRQNRRKPKSTACLNNFSWNESMFRISLRLRKTHIQGSKIPID